MTANFSRATNLHSSFRTSAGLVVGLGLLTGIGCDSGGRTDEGADYRSGGGGSPAATPWTDLVSQPGSGLDYARAPSPTKATFDAQKAASIADPPTPYTFGDVVATPEKSNGGPGVAALDFDGDGDVDIYATNGPGRANSLFSNQLQETGVATFIDVGAAAGAGVAGQDSTGVCFGDIDNDGDEDLYVLGRVESNALLENQGDGTFVDITGSAGTGGGTLGHTSCSMGDVDGDGLLDIVVGNSFDWASREAIFVDDFGSSHPNQLFVNQGGNVFSDESVASGIRNLRGFSDGSENNPTITWGIAIVDIDLDGDSDIVQADDQAARLISAYIDPNTGLPGVDRGFMHVLINDGTGHFTDITPEAGLTRPGQWMGVTFGDFNSDGNMDFFGTNMGGYAFSVLPIQYAIEDTNNRWFLGNGDLTWDDPGLGDIVSDPFGWGPSALDYDNDGDTDIMYFGSLDGTGPVGTADNPGVLLSNDGVTGEDVDFSADLVALSGTDHRRRNVNGSAVGDINNDGFMDIISVSASNYFDAPLIPYPVSWGSPYDAFAAFFPVFSQTGPGEFTWNGFEQTEGDLSVQVNTADNGNRWVRVRTLGTVGITDDGQSNRDGIGAVVQFTPNKGNTAMKPILGGSNYSSQDSTDAIFGLGGKNWGTIDVVWPGGTHNRLRFAKHGESITFPEIPCDYRHDQWSKYNDYKVCVKGAMDELQAAGVVSPAEAARFKSSALSAYWQDLMDD